MSTMEPLCSICGEKLVSFIPEGATAFHTKCGQELLRRHRPIMRNHNICLMSDSYKYTHHKQYPPGTEYVYSYLESRGGVFDETVFFGLQYYCKEYLEGVVVTKEMVEEAKEIIDAHLGPGIFNYDGWMYIVEQHGGKLPVEIRAVPEGIRINVSNVLMTIVNTDPKCFWLPNFLETLLLKVWYPISVATLSRKTKELIQSYLEMTGDPSLIDFKLHDFGYRGVSSEESAGIGCAAHGVNFKGTDTIAGIMLLRKYYKASMPMFSIPAMEHSTVTSWGEEYEADSYENMLKSYPKSLVSIVCDSYDTYKTCKEIFGEKLKGMIEDRDGVLVVRPDSGVPHEVVLQVLNILGSRFGFEFNKKGYKVLPPFIRVIQGDGVNYHSIRQILRKMEAEQWSADNITFGQGGALLQGVNRDTHQMAIKCAAICVNGVWRDVYKRPKTDSGKNSKRGQLALLYNGGNKFITVRKEPGVSYWGDRLELVFKNGNVLREQHLEEIRRLSNQTDYRIEDVRATSLKEMSK